MKIRSGFVSNSSTSSFLIYGVYFQDESDFNEYFDEKMCDFSPDNIECYSPYDDASFYIGFSLDRCKDNQTMGDFKKQCRDEINKISDREIPEKDFSVMEESWRDG